MAECCKYARFVLSVEYVFRSLSSAFSSQPKNEVKEINSRLVIMIGLLDICCDTFLEAHLEIKQVNFINAQVCVYFITLLISLSKPAVQISLVIKTTSKFMVATTKEGIRKSRKSCLMLEFYAFIGH